MLDDDSDSTVGDADPSSGPPSFMQGPVGSSAGAPPPSAIQGSIAGGQTTAFGGTTPPQGTPSQKPSFFKGIISALGMALAQGAKAGVQAPMNPQGPAIAARTAIEQPQKDFEQKMANQKALTSADMDKLTIAMTQLKIHQLQMITSKMEDDQQDAVYNTGRDALETLADKGKVEILASGDYNSVTAEFQRRQTDAKTGGQGLLPLQILPALGSTASKPQYSLIMVGKEKLAEGWDETWGASDLGYNADDFKAAGLSSFKFHAAAGMDQQKALALYASQHLQWATKSETAMNKWKTNEANRTSRESEGKKNRDNRMAIAELNASTRRATASMKSLNDTTDKEIISAGKTLISANKALGDAQGKIGNKAWDTLGGGETREITTKRRARDEAEKNYETLLQKKGAGTALNDQTKPTAVEKGTMLTKAIAQQYKQKAGGDVKKAQQLAAADGYVWPKTTTPPAQ